MSYRYLDPGRQRFFRSLGWHPGTTIESYAAAALTGCSIEDAAAQLDALHREGLLTQVSYRRYGMHDLIRRYARDRGAADPGPDGAQGLERLLDYYQHTAALAESPLPEPGAQHRPGAGHRCRQFPSLPGQPRHWNGPGLNVSNLIACLDLATRTGLQARVVALAAAVATLLRHDGPGPTPWPATPPPSRPRGISATGQVKAAPSWTPDSCGWLTGDYPGAATDIEQALSISRDLGDQLGQANALACLGTVRWLTGDYPAAAAALEEALDIARRLGDQLGQANTLNDLAAVRWLTGDYPAAAAALEEGWTSPAVSVTSSARPTLSPG